MGILYLNLDNSTYSVYVSDVSFDDDFLRVSGPLLKRDSSFCGSPDVIDVASLIFLVIDVEVKLLSLGYKLSLVPSYGISDLFSVPKFQASIPWNLLLDKNCTLGEDFVEDVCSWSDSDRILSVLGDIFSRTEILKFAGTC